MLPARALGLPQSIEIDYGEKVETITNFIFLDCKITAEGDYSHEIKRHVLLGRKAMINLDSVLKMRHHFTDKGLYSQSYAFSIWLTSMYGCESWPIKKAECQRTDAFKLWCWRRFFRVPWTARRSN